jgi:hypothetical protein
MVDGLSMVDRQSFPPYDVEPEVTNMAGKDMDILIFRSRHFELQQPKWRETVFLDLFDLCSPIGSAASAACMHMHACHADATAAARRQQLLTLPMHTHCW